MNMVRAGIVNHAEEWPYCGYQEIIGLRQRYTIIDKKKLSEILSLNPGSLKDIYETWIEEYMNMKNIISQICLSKRNLSVKIIQKKDYLIEYTALAMAGPRTFYCPAY